LAILVWVKKGTTKRVLKNVFAKFVVKNVVVLQKFAVKSVVIPQKFVAFFVM